MDLTRLNARLSDPDYDKPIALTPADKAFHPLDKRGCPLVKA
jgi:hypothetical protein